MRKWLPVKVFIFLLAKVCIILLTCKLDDYVITDKWYPLKHSCSNALSITLLTILEIK